MSQVRISWNVKEEERLSKGPQLRQALDRIGFTITGHAVPHCGVDTGRLVNSMTHGIEEDGNELALFLGSNAHDPSLQPVSYASTHWAGKPDPDNTPSTTKEIRGRKRNKKPRKTPTTPYTKALKELGITATGVEG